MKYIVKNKKVASILVFVAFSFIISACGSKPRYSHNKISNDQLTVISTAKKMLGVKYRYGGTNPSRGFDCSGLVQYSHKAAGVHLPRTTGQQYRAATPISKRNLKPGDLVFFKIAVSRAVSHVGIYLGNSQFIHAPSSGKRVKISSMKEKYWRKRFTGAGRVL
ncbi:MAG: C40 family peptidase [Gammaproteobacteria bacterium]|nr:C40 family peptidase [Gammaproteobacteria bacterium]